MTSEEVKAELQRGPRLCAPGCLGLVLAGLGGDAITLFCTVPDLPRRAVTTTWRTARRRLRTLSTRRAPSLRKVAAIETRVPWRNPLDTWVLCWREPLHDAQSQVTDPILCKNLQNHFYHLRCSQFNMFEQVCVASLEHVHEQSALRVSGAVSSSCE